MSWKSGMGQAVKIEKVVEVLEDEDVDVRLGWLAAERPEEVSVKVEYLRGALVSAEIFTRREKLFNKSDAPAWQRANLP